MLHLRGLQACRLHVVDHTAGCGLLLPVDNIERGDVCCGTAATAPPRHQKLLLWLPAW